MSNGLKNLQSAARAHSRRERLETSQALAPGYDDDSGISGIGLTPVDDLDPSYSSPETASTGGHSVSGGSAASVAGYAPASHHHFSMHPMHSGDYYAPHHGYTSSVSSTASGSAGYSTSSHHHSQSSSPYLHPHAQRLPSADMGIEAIINRPRGGAPPHM